MLPPPPGGRRSRAPAPCCARLSRPASGSRTACGTRGSGAVSAGHRSRQGRPRSSRDRPSLPAPTLRRRRLSDGPGSGQNRPYG
jgi:hypothetical protein